jgi:hypothetical protein
MRKQDPSQLYAPVARNGDLATLRWLRRRVRVRLPDGLFVQCVRERSPLAALRWLVEEADCPVDWTAALEAHKRLAPVADWGVDEAVVQVRGWLEAEYSRSRSVWQRRCQRRRDTGVIRQPQLLQQQQTPPPDGGAFTSCLPGRLRTWQWPSFMATLKKRQTKLRGAAAATTDVDLAWAAAAQVDLIGG